MHHNLLRPSCEKVNKYNRQNDKYEVLNKFHIYLYNKYLYFLNQYISKFIFPLNQHNHYFFYFSYYTVFSNVG